MVEDVLHLFRGFTARDRHHHGKKTNRVHLWVADDSHGDGGGEHPSKGHVAPHLANHHHCQDIGGFSTDMQGEKEAAEESLVV